jgi:O-antigen/teichoic acid export membrane protein
VPTASPTGAPTKGDDDSLLSAIGVGKDDTAWALSGIIIGAIVLLALILLVLVEARRQGKRLHQRTPPEDQIDKDSAWMIAHGFTLSTGRADMKNE